MKNRNYFNTNVNMVVEIEGDYGRFRQVMRGTEVKAYCKRHDGEISDVDFCATQPDEWCRKVFNTAEYNFRHNREWCRKMGFTSLYDVVGYAADHMAA